MLFKAHIRAVLTSGYITGADGVNRVGPMGIGCFLCEHSFSLEMEHDIVVYPAPRKNYYDALVGSVAETHISAALC